eukprot:361313-Chlamydomonas_euryale.AAC.2
MIGIVQHFNCATSSQGTLPYATNEPCVPQLFMSDAMRGFSAACSLALGHADSHLELAFELLSSACCCMLLCDTIVELRNHSLRIFAPTPSHNPASHSGLQS